MHFTTTTQRWHHDGESRSSRCNHHLHRTRLEARSLQHSLLLLSKEVCQERASSLFFFGAGSWHRHHPQLGCPLLPSVAHPRPFGIRRDGCQIANGMNWWRSTTSEMENRTRLRNWSFLQLVWFAINRKWKESLDDFTASNTTGPVVNQGLQMLDGLHRSN